MTILTRLSGGDGSWQRLKADWDRQCQEAEEDFAAYSSGGFSVVEQLALNEEPKAGVYALVRNGVHDAMCQANIASLPGYSTPVLRTRFMTLAPRFDFGELSVEEYGNVLADVFSGVINLSSTPGTMRADHVKFHLPSPQDRPFFAHLGSALDRSSAFASVRMRGGWLYVTKNQ